MTTTGVPSFISASIGSQWSSQDGRGTIPKLLLKSYCSSAAIACDKLKSVEFAPPAERIDARLFRAPSALIKIEKA